MTDVNRQYRRLFRRDYDGIRTRRSDAYREALRDLDVRVKAAEKEQRPKRAPKSWHLPDDVLAALVAVTHAQLAATRDPLTTILTAATASRQSRLNAWCDAVQIVQTESYHRIDSSCTSAYRSQGFGAEKYARESVRPWEDALQAAGLSPHVSRTAISINPTAQWSCDREMVTFILWVNCEPYVADAVRRRLTLAAAIRSWKANSVNPLVYDPFIPHAMVS